MWATYLLRYWYWIAIISLTCALGVSMLHGRVLSARLDTKIAVIDSMKREADNYRVQSEAIAKEISDAIPRVVEQAKNEAWKNWKARYGTGNAACGIRTDGLLPASHSASQADSTQGTDATSGEQLAIEACARDAGRLDGWIKWAELNQLPVE